MKPTDQYTKFRGRKAPQKLDRHKYVYHVNVRTLPPVLTQVPAQSDPSRHIVNPCLLGFLQRIHPLVFLIWLGHLEI